MSDWQPMKTAERDGRILQSYWGDVPVYIAWDKGRPSRTERQWGFLFYQTRIIPAVKAGWRVVTLGRGGSYGIHGNYAPFIPPAWMPLPEPPK
jgi:hypothetical protein